MKISRTGFYIILSSVALLAVVAIQVSWIIETAQIKEQIFNEKAKMVLSKATEILKSDLVVYQNKACQLAPAQRKKIDSLVHHYMAQYGIQTTYRLEVKSAKPTPHPKAELNNSFTGNLLNPAADKPGCYSTCLEQPAGKSLSEQIELTLVIPEKAVFIRGEMGMPFALSIILLVVVMTISGHTMVSLQAEKQVAESTTAYLNNMTHELKTPITNVALASRMLTRESYLDQPEKVKHFSRIIAEENEKLRIQVEQVLGMSALDRGQIPIQKSQTNVHQIITEILDGMSLQFENRKATVELSLNATNFFVFADAVQLGNAIRNLVDNALKYSPNSPKVLIKTESSQDVISIFITDHGIGIARHYQKRVFTAFFRVPTGNRHDVKGFGLGLAYARKIAELHGGRLSLESEPSKGSTFTLTIPYA